MKNINIFFLLLAILVAGNSYGQTKEETIERLKVNGVDISYNISYYDCGGGAQCEKIFKIVSITEDSLSYYGGSALKGHNWETTRSVAFKDILFEDVSTLQQNSYGFYAIKTRLGNFYIFSKNNEENTKRTITAIMHLAKLTGAKENKQTF